MSRIQRFEGTSIALAFLATHRVGPLTFTRRGSRWNPPRWDRTAALFVGDIRRFSVTVEYDGGVAIYAPLVGYRTWRH